MLHALLPNRFAVRIVIVHANGSVLRLFVTVNDTPVMQFSLFFLAFCLTLAACSDAARILGMFPFHGLSHFLFFKRLLVELAKRGHEVVVVGHYPLTTDEAPSNYRDIDLSGSLSNYTSNIPFFQPKFGNVYENMRDLYQFVREDELLLSSDQIQRFLRSHEKFDLMLTEYFASRIYFAFAYKFGVPTIALSSSRLLPWASYDMADPLNPSYIPNVLGLWADRMSFWERLGNALQTAAMTVAFETVFEWKFASIVRKHFGVETPSPRWLARNISLMLSPAYSGAILVRPTAAAVIEVGGMHIAEAKSLPKDIEKFINGSEHGVIYFCMGSLLRGSSFPEDKRKAFLYAFSKIPQRVLWKWEGDNLPGKPDNVMIAKWMPQRDILAHPNVKLFISHGGLLGTNEAVYEGVPILGIPIFGDQRTNVKSIEASGAGELLDYNDISDEVVFGKIQKLLHDPKYRENAKELSRRYRDRPMSPLDTAVYWTEYVIRHKGAHHLRSAAVDLPWYQYLLLDVIAFVLLVLVVSLLSVYYSIKFTLRFIFRKLFGKKQPTKSEKSKKKLN